MTKNGQLRSCRRLIVSSPAIASDTLPDRPLLLALICPPPLCGRQSVSYVHSELRLVASLYQLHRSPLLPALLRPDECRSVYRLPPLPAEPQPHAVLVRASHGPAVWSVERGRERERAVVGRWDV